MIEAAEAAGELGRAASSSSRPAATPASRSPWSPAEGLPAHLRHARERRPRSGASCSSSSARRSSSRPASEGSNGAVRVALRDGRAASPTTSCRSSTATRPTRARTTRAPARRSPRRSTGVDVFVAGLGTGGTLMGAGDAAARGFPDVVVAAAEPLPGDPVMGLRSLEDGYVPPILDVSKLDRKLLVANDEAAEGVRALLEREAIFAGRVVGRGRPGRRPPGKGARGRGRSRASSPTAAGSTSRHRSGTAAAASSTRSSGGSPRGGPAGDRGARSHGDSERGLWPPRPPRRRRRSGTSPDGTRRESGTGSSSRPTPRSGSSRTTGTTSRSCTRTPRRRPPGPGLLEPTSRTSASGRAGRI